MPFLAQLHKIATDLGRRAVPLRQLSFLSQLLCLWLRMRKSHLLKVENYLKPTVREMILPYLALFF